ncbi:hypothetical protein CFC21_010870 [Triticum aestivum]|uniref:Uncharacterized protein n=2 Tax=Triticum aestivum TaxID=4565 RepID=A0A3B5ZQV2_WHEAT|nr:hypothetical protein CFC21_010870 [Triticum aestivum]
MKWTTGEKACGGGQALKWETELASPNDDNFDLKWKWEAKSKPGAVGKAKTKWGTEEANKDDKKKPARKCVQSKEIPVGWTSRSRLHLIDAIIGTGFYGVRDKLKHYKDTMGIV